jgi:hypothetical protein
MALSALLKLPPSAAHGWREFARNPPALGCLYAGLVLPLSLLPPAMLYRVGSTDPQAFVQFGRAKDWMVLAVVFLAAERVTIMGMGWFIRQVTRTNGLDIGYRQAYLLAGIAPIPLWLSALGLLAPEFLFNLMLSLAAMGLSCGIIYHGIQAFCGTRDEMAVAGIVHTVIGGGFVGGAFLLAMVLL